MNFAEIIEGHASESVALVSRGRTTTYKELCAQVAALRGAFTELGITRGDRVALLCGNSRYFVVSYLATLGIGAVVVPLNPMSPAAELQRELRLVGARVVVVEPAATSAWRGISRSDIPAVTTVIATDGHEIDGALTLGELLNHAPAPVIGAKQDQLAVLMFTSGTAGSPRAAMLSHWNLLANVRQLNGPASMSSSDVVFGVLPLFHIFGLNVMLGYTLFIGASLVLVQRFDPVTALETILERHVTVVPGTPQLWSAFAQLPGLSAQSFAGVRLALTGAAKMPEDITRLFQERFSLNIYEGYGLTEASPVVSTSIGRECKVGSIGQMLPGVEARLVDENGEDTLSGDAGELWVRGDNVFMGYLDDPDATARVLTPDGWLRTGDVAVIDDEGYTFLVDRVKDLIIVSGFNVYPAEVETVLRSHRQVLEAAVVGVAHPHTGEAVRAFIVPKPGVHLDEDVIIEFCQKHLARYKCPSKILIVEALPMSSTGKVLRRALH